MKIKNKEVMRVKSGLDLLIEMMGAEKKTKFEWHTTYYVAKLKDAIVRQLEILADAEKLMLEDQGEMIFTRKVTNNTGQSSEAFDQEGKEKLIASGQYDLGENAESYDKGRKKLLEEEFELDEKIGTFSLSELKKMKVTPQIIFGLLPIIKNDIEEEENKEE